MQNGETPETASGAAQRHRLSHSDRLILGLLKQDSRRTISEIAATIGMSRTSIKDRIDMMKEKGIIRRFTVEIAETQQAEPAYGSAFFQLRLKRPVCRLIYSAISGWPELLGCWSIAVELDMVVLVAATSNREVERLRDRLARHPEVKTLHTLSILRDWINIGDFRNSEILDAISLNNSHSA
ncbi:MAG: Lrp/AsnC family transcriptional regulator [Proteobacteria bacterium]|nr:Lrp/AsnC family transcriptional regulator [Pseudomonadota bacterium]